MVIALLTTRRSFGSGFSSPRMVDLTFFLDFPRLSWATDFLQMLDKSSICVSPVTVGSPSVPDTVFSSYRDA